MSTVYVLNKDGKPLMPTTRGGHVRHLLKEQKARVVRAKPFTIQLLYETNDVVQPLYLGIGRAISSMSGFIMFIRTDGLVKTNLCQGIPISQQSAVVPKDRFRTSAGPCDNCQLVFLATRLSQQTLL